jgi:hypothetical protein
MLTDVGFGRSMAHDLDIDLRAGDACGAGGNGDGGIDGRMCLKADFGAVSEIKRGFADVPAQPNRHDYRGAHMCFALCMTRVPVLDLALQPLPQLQPMQYVGSKTPGDGEPLGAMPGIEPEDISAHANQV